MKNKEYWEMRSQQRILDGEEDARQVAKRVERMYRSTMRSIESEINSFHVRYAKKWGITLEEAHRLLTPSELKRFREQANEYYQYGKEHNWDIAYQKEIRLLSGKAYMSRLEELKVNLYFEIQKLYEFELQELEQGLKTFYDETFYRTMYDFQTGYNIGFSFAAPNINAIDKTIRTRWIGSNYSSRVWADKTSLIQVMNQEIPRSIALGENPLKLATRMRKAMESRFVEREQEDVNGNRRRLQSNCERLARTEFNHIANESSYDSIRMFDEELGGGLFEKYQYSATLDGKTSEICQSLDGKQFLMTEKEIGVNFPPMHPNCRSTYTVVVDDREITERIARDPSGKLYYVPGNITYEEWYSGLTDETKLQYRVANNRKNDLAQLNKYREKMGRKNLPRSVAEFQKIKYYEPDNWKALKNQYKNTSTN